MYVCVCTCVHVYNMCVCAREQTTKDYQECTQERRKQFDALKDRDQKLSKEIDEQGKKLKLLEVRSIRNLAGVGFHCYAVVVVVVVVVVYFIYSGNQNRHNA